MSLGEFVLNTAIECIKVAREQGVDNWLNGIISDEDFKSACKADAENRANGSYQRLVSKQQNLREDKS